MLVYKVASMSEVYRGLLPDLWSIRLRRVALITHMLVYRVAPISEVYRGLPDDASLWHVVILSLQSSIERYQVVSIPVINQL